MQETGALASVLELLRGGPNSEVQLSHVAFQSNELPINGSVRVGAACQGCYKSGYLNWEAV